MSKSSRRPDEILAEIAVRDQVLAMHLRRLKADFRDDQRVLDLLDGLIGTLSGHEGFAREWAEHFTPRPPGETRQTVVVPLRPSSPGEDTRAWQVGRVPQMRRNQRQR